MINSNTKNRENKEAAIGDTFFICGEKYEITSETERVYRAKYKGNNPKAKQKETWYKITFNKRFFFNGRFWSVLRNTKAPNPDYS